MVRAALQHHLAAWQDSRVLEARLEDRVSAKPAMAQLESHADMQ